MEQTVQIPVDPRRVFRALVCLVAVILLWAPMGAAAWQTNGMACCKGNMCMAHKHSKSKRSEPQQSTLLECAHHSESEATKCSMSCCHETDPTLIGAVVFLLPTPGMISQSFPVTAALPNFAAKEFLGSFEPIAPPPRTALI